MKNTIWKVALAAGLAVSGVTAHAETLTAGFASEPSSVDPLYHNLGPNNALRKHMFEALVGEDENLGIVPMLAESWSNPDDLTWEFKLRDGVKFHDAPILQHGISFTRLAASRTFPTVRPRWKGSSNVPKPSRLRMTIRSA
ncbi:ABC transporter substrate-binding protein [Roseibium sp.]|uniref:ABC transporter substrate-binding protein n=1 Tax=Roseibium sp. TaxID=1936156 RepID=UPI00263A38E6|nr:ABC transporter substrate-binding protein [Roseibium sp.]